MGVTEKGIAVAKLGVGVSGRENESQRESERQRRSSRMQCTEKHNGILGVGASPQPKLA